MNAAMRPASVGELDHLRLKQAVLGGFVVAGFDRRLALLLQIAGVEELFALVGIGRSAVPHVRLFERDLTFQLDQLR